MSNSEIEQALLDCGYLTSAEEKDELTEDEYDHHRKFAAIIHTAAFKEIGEWLEAHLLSVKTDLPQPFSKAFVKDLKAGHLPGKPHASTG